jgi:glycosyltransferase involved in cell wall biosynthesis
VAISKWFDMVLLQRTTFPFKLETLLVRINKNIIFDIDDAIYLADKQGNDILTRIKKYIKKNEVINILKASRAVIVENGYIKDFVSRYAKNVFKIPGPIDTERFFVREKKKRKELIIGWIGSPATTPYLHMLGGIFGIIKKKYNFVKFNFIGLGKYKNADIDFSGIAWDYETEVGELQMFDIGIMPMSDNEWTRGKLGCKMLQYMAVGIPAVVSYTRTNAEIIEDGKNGFLVSNEDEWIKVLSALIENEGLRETIGQKGREIILEKCSLSGNINRLTDIFKSIEKN